MYVTLQGERGFGLEVRLSDVPNVSTRILQRGSHRRDESLHELLNRLCFCCNGSCLVITIVLCNQSAFVVKFVVGRLDLVYKE